MTKPKLFGNRRVTPVSEADTAKFTKSVDTRVAKRVRERVSAQRDKMAKVRSRPVR